MVNTTVNNNVHAESGLGEHNYNYVGHSGVKNLSVIN
jgi:hypothetical protein